MNRFTFIATLFSIPFWRDVITTVKETEKVHAQFKPTPEQMQDLETSLRNYLVEQMAKDMDYQLHRPTGILGKQQSAWFKFEGFRK